MPDAACHITIEGALRLHDQRRTDTFLIEMIAKKDDE
jgi:hypothetical protein